MKKLVVIISLMMAFSMMIAPAVMANTIVSSGEWVELVSYNSGDNAGIMRYAVSNSNGGTILGYYDTFCIQDNVYIWPNTWYPVADVSSNVGFFAPGPPPDGPAGTGPLVGAVDYLFYLYTIGKYGSMSPAQQTDFQELLWNLQGSGGPFTTDTTAAWYADWTAWKGDPNLQHTWGTQVINIASGYSPTSGFTGPDIQNQLYNADTVPEPVTILLLGLGLMGVAGVRRRLQK